jgi:hypothetical protein
LYTLLATTTESKESIWLITPDEESAKQEALFDMRAQ